MPISKHGTSYVSLGDTGKETLIFIHGLGLNNGINWADFIVHFKAQYHVVTYDLIGHGNSKKAKNYPINLTDLSQQLCLLMDDLHIEKAHLIGFSLGGMINRRFALDYEHRVLSLSILNSPHERDSEAQKIVEARASKTQEEGIESTLDDTIKRWFSAHFMTQHQTKIDEVKNILLANDLHNYSAHRIILAQGVIELINPAPPISKPTLVITCENDTGSTPIMSQKIAAEIKQAHLHIIPKLQHLAIIEAPPLFIKPIQHFLDNITYS